MKRSMYLLSDAQVYEDKKSFKERMKRNAEISRMLEKYNKMKVEINEKMKKLYETVEIETDERKRVSAWEELKKLDSEISKFAMENKLAYSSPVEIRW